MKYFKILLFLFLLPGDNGNWELKKNEDNIMVYTRRVITSDFKELKSITHVKSSLSSIVHILIDVNHFTDWIYKCVTATVVKKVNDREVISYQLFDAPFPFDDRDVVAQCFVIQDTITKIVTVRSVLADGLIPEKDGVVRIKNFHTKYILTPEANGFVRIDYELGSEPGGAIPAWLANLVMVNGPFSTQLMMNNLLQTPAIKNTRLPFIEEP